jgi:hypothetical protein
LKYFVVKRRNIQSNHVELLGKSIIF